VIENDPSWTVNDCVQYIAPRFQQHDLPYLEEEATVSFIESKAVFSMIELVLYEIPLFVLGVAAYLLSTLSIYFWYKLYYRMNGLCYESSSLSKSTSTTTFGVEDEIRCLEVTLLDKPYSFVKRANFMKRARGKMNWFNTNYTYFVNQRWRFDHSNVKALYQSLDAVSRRKYNFDVDQIDFNKYAYEAALVCFRKYIEYRDEKKKNQMQFEEGLREKLQCLRLRQRAQSGYTLSADERKQILNVLRNLFFTVGLDTKVTVGIAVAMSVFATFSFFYR